MSDYEGLKVNVQKTRLFQTINTAEKWFTTPLILPNEPLCSDEYFILYEFSKIVTRMSQTGIYMHIDKYYKIFGVAEGRDTRTNR